MRLSPQQRATAAKVGAVLMIGGFLIQQIIPPTGIHALNDLIPTIVFGAGAILIAMAAGTN